MNFVYRSLAVVAVVLCRAEVVWEVDSTRVASHVGCKRSVFLTIRIAAEATMEGR